MTCNSSNQLEKLGTLNLEVNKDGGNSELHTTYTYSNKLTVWHYIITYVTVTSKPVKGR